MQSVLARKNNIIVMICLAVAVAANTMGSNALAGPGRPVKHLPPGAARVLHGNIDYFFHKGRFYKPGKGIYVKVRPPLGIVVASLPAVAATVVVGGITYYYCDTVYYRKVAGGYRVVELPPETTVKVVDHHGSDFYAVGSRVAVRVDRLNVRTGPDRSSPVETVVGLGDQLEVKGRAPGWLYVRLPGGSRGWVMVKYVALAEPEVKG